MSENTVAGHVQCLFYGQPEALVKITFAPYLIVIVFWMKYWPVIWHSLLYSPYFKIGVENKVLNM